MNDPIFPVSTNWIMSSPDQEDNTGRISLYENKNIQLVSNLAFEDSLVLYNEVYENTQAYSPRFQLFMDEIAKIIMSHTNRSSHVVEIGCGQGDFFSVLDGLNHFSSLEAYDAVYRGNDSRIQKRYINPDDRLKSDFLILRHVLEHIVDPFSYLEMLYQVFGDVPIYIEVPNYQWIKQEQKFCEVFYEHIHYFSIDTFRQMFNGLIDAREVLDTQYLYIVARLSNLNHAFKASFDQPDNWSLLSLETLFPNIGVFFQELKSSLTTDKKIYIWGASSKACMLLVYAQAYGLLNRFFLAVDINPNRWDHYLPVSKIKIVNKDIFYQCVKPNDLLIISNPVYADEIKKDLHLHGVNIQTKIL